MALELEGLRELLDPTERQLAEVCELRRELALQTELLAQLLEKPASLERSQYS
jgi:hypothetical protein